MLAASQGMVVYQVYQGFHLACKLILSQKYSKLMGKNRFGKISTD